MSDGELLSDCPPPSPTPSPLRAAANFDYIAIAVAAAAAARRAASVISSLSSLLRGSNLTLLCPQLYSRATSSFSGAPACHWDSRATCLGLAYLTLPYPYPHRGALPYLAHLTVQYLAVPHQTVSSELPRYCARPRRSSPATSTRRRPQTLPLRPRARARSRPHRPQLHPVRLRERERSSSAPLPPDRLTSA